MIMIFVNGWVQRQRKFLPHCWRTSKPTWQPNTSFYTPNGNWWPALISSLLKLITSWRDYLTTVSLPVCHGWLHHEVTTWQPYPLLSAVVDYIMKWLLDNRIPSCLPWLITSWSDYLTTVSLPVCHGWLHHEVTTWQPYPFLSAMGDYTMLSASSRKTQQVFHLCHTWLQHSQSQHLSSNTGLFSSLLHLVTLEEWVLAPRKIYSSSILSSLLQLVM